MELFEANSCPALDVKYHILSAASVDLYKAPGSFCGTTHPCSAPGIKPRRPCYCKEKKPKLSGGGVLDKYASSLSPRGLELPFTHDHSTADSTGTSPWGVGQWITTVRRLFSLVFWFIKKVICSSQKSHENGLLYSWNPIWGQFQ